MMPSEFRCRSGYNWQGGATLLLLVWNHFWHQKWSLLSSLLMPVLYFLFIIMALSPMMDSFDRGHYSMGYREYALVGLMAMNLVTQMGGTIHQVYLDRKNGLFAMHMQSGIRPLLYIILKGLPSVLGFLFQASCFWGLIVWFQIQIFGDHFVWLCLVGLISLFFWIGMGVILSLFSGSGITRNMVLSFFLMLLTFSAPSFYVYENAPWLVKFVSRLNPLTYQLEVMRDAAFASPSWQSLALLCLLSLLSLAVAMAITNRIPLFEKEQSP